MKKIKILTMAFIAMSFASCGEKAITETNTVATETTNGVTTSSFKVWGNCEMCKETIEGSLKVDGVSKADWDVDSKIITVEFDAAKIDLDKIQKTIAAVGYDNDKYKGDDKAYNELAGCCQYDRK